MLGRLFIRLIDAQEPWARPLGDWVHGLVAAVFGRMVRVRSLLNGTWLGHPLHAVLTDAPIGRPVPRDRVRRARPAESPRTSRSCSASWRCSRRRSSATRTTR